jgi:hypothetical protein
MHAYSTAGWESLFVALAGRIVMVQVAVVPLLVAGVSLPLGAGGDRHQGEVIVEAG